MALTIMVGSGLRIFNAYPAFARRGETFCCYPFEHKSIPKQLTFGGWLGGARNWHFAMMWLLVVNGLIYVAFVYLHGEWRDVVPRKSFARDSVAMLSYYLFIRKRHPLQGKYNALQRGTYFILPILGVVAVISGIAIWKPVQLQWLTDLMGGYVWARYWHFLSMVLLVALSAIHIFMVLTVDPYALRAIITGGYDPSKSPEARNARPFYHLLPISRSNGAHNGVSNGAAAVARSDANGVSTEMKGPMSSGAEKEPIGAGAEMKKPIPSGVDMKAARDAAEEKASIAGPDETQEPVSFDGGSDIPGGTK